MNSTVQKEKMKLSKCLEGKYSKDVTKEILRFYDPDLNHYFGLSHKKQK